MTIFKFKGKIYEIVDGFSIKIYKNDKEKVIAESFSFDENDDNLEKENDKIMFFGDILGKDIDEDFEFQLDDSKEENIMAAKVIKSVLLNFTKNNIQMECDLEPLKCHVFNRTDYDEMDKVDGYFFLGNDNTYIVECKTCNDVANILIFISEYDKLPVRFWWKGIKW